MKVTFDNAYSAFQVIAPKGTMISFTGEPTALADGVYLVGDDGIINLDEQFLTDTLYLSTEGTDYTVTGGMRVTYPLGDETVIIRAGSSTIPFSKGGKGGGGSGDGTHYKGTTTTALTDGSTTNPITILIEDEPVTYTAVMGDIVVYGSSEFIFDSNAWKEIGRGVDTTPTSGSVNFVTSDGIYKNTAGKKIAYGGEAFNNYVGVNANEASGQHSHAEGYATTASGQYSHASGSYTRATQKNMTAIGTFNSPRTNDLFNIGNGSTVGRSNIVEVNHTSMNVNGAITQNGTPVLVDAGTLPSLVYDSENEIFEFNPGTLPSGGVSS